jgi:hypothetical protein
LALEDMVTVSLEAELTPKGSDEPRRVLERALSDLVEGLKQAGCTLIGHIKGRIATGDGRPLFFSITTLDNNLSFKGGPLGGDGPLSLAVNVIVAGIEKDEVTKLLESSLNRYYHFYQPR